MGLSLLHCLYPTSTHSNDKPVLARAPSSYLNNNRVVFDEEGGFYCRVSDRGDKICMDKSKGHQHPTISPEVKDKLRNYFKPLNKRFYRAVGDRLWMVLK